NKNWKSSGINASNISQFYLISGNVGNAVKYGQQSVEYADKSEDNFEKESNRTYYATALHQAGEFSLSNNLFVEAELMQQKSRPEFQYLYSSPGHWYCDLLLSMNNEQIIIINEKRDKIEEILKRAKHGLEISTRNNWLLDTGLDNLTIGKALFAKAVLNRTDFKNPSDESLFHINTAVEGLRKAGSQEYIATGLLARAAFYCHYGEYQKALEDLEEVLEIAESGGMKLYLTDYHLEMARLHLAQNQSKEAREHCTEAKKLIEETGYKRREREWEELSKNVN